MEATSGRGNGGGHGHVLILPWPTQSHINPMLQFAKRVASRGPLATLVLTRFLLESAPPSLLPDPIPMRLAAISDGFDKGGRAEAPDVGAYMDRFARVGPEALEALIRSEAEAGRPVDALVFDPFLSWPADVGRRLGVATAAFLTQSCAADAVYFHVFEGRVKWPVGEAVELPGLPRLEPRDLPSFLQPSISYPNFILEMLKNQYLNWEKLDDILINSFSELENKEADYMAATCGAKTVGPTVPSTYLDRRLPADSRYGFQLYEPIVAPCMNWLDARPPASVVYTSFGSLAELSLEQMSELAYGLSNSGTSFLWVVRSLETHKLPGEFASSTAAELGSSVAAGRGLVVPWCPQLDVLAHEAVGCFVSHCGWNSTLEALSLGVPMIGVPHWSDQTMNARYLEEQWRVGVKARKDEEGVVRREEVERCVREVMDGERREEYRKNAAKYRELAKAAMGDGGSSDKNIAEFVAKYCSKRYRNGH